jgi:hypothetical protein
VSRHRSSQPLPLLDWSSSVIGGMSLGVALMWVVTMRSVTGAAVAVAAVMGVVGVAVALAALTGHPRVTQPPGGTEVCTEEETREMEKVS